MKGFIFNSVMSSLHSLTDFLLPIITWPKDCLSEFKMFIIIVVKLIVFTLEILILSELVGTCVVEGSPRTKLIKQLFSSTKNASED